MGPAGALLGVYLLDVQLPGLKHASYYMFVLKSKTYTFTVIGQLKSNPHCLQLKESSPSDTRHHSRIHEYAVHGPPPSVGRGPWRRPVFLAAAHSHTPPDQLQQYCK